MVAITRIPTAFISDRLDGRYNSPFAVSIRKQIKTSGIKFTQVSNVFDLVCGPFGSTLTADEHSSGGEVLLIQPTNISGDIFSEDSSWRITKKDQVKKGLKLYDAGTLLFARVGVYPHTGILPVEAGLATISSSMIAGLPKKNIDTHYVCSFFKSNHGFQLLLAAQKVTAQPTIGTTEIGNTEIPIPDAIAQKYIGDKVRQAERLRAWAKTLDINITAYFADLVANPLPPRVSWLAKKEDLDSYRINPKQYDPVVLNLIYRAKANGMRLEPLSELIGARQIAGGATPKGAQYFDKGVLFARVQNVKPLRLDLSDAVYIDQSADEELARSRCATNDIILTITGYPGTASLVTEEDLPVNINQHSVRFNIRDDIEPGYVCAALNSKFLKYQVDRLAIGGTRDALDYPSVGRLLIPRYESELEQKIGEQARSVIAAEKLSQRLTNAAKLFVEALIEGSLTEADLIAAEQALQTGNDQLDRSILNRLKTYGIDGQGQPLLSDLDQLYSLLEQANEPVG